VTALLGDQPTDQSDICRPISGEPLFHCTPQLRPGVAEIWRREHGQLTGDHVGHQPRLVVEPAIDRRLTRWRDPRDR
jgi:hypothetical protein